jgi:hypothetical protein
MPSEGLRAAETPEEWAHQKIILDGDLTETLKISSHALDVLFERRL